MSELNCDPRGRLHTFESSLRAAGWCLVIVVAVLVAAAWEVRAQNVSLAGDNIIDDVRYTPPGEPETTFTLLRHADNRYQWYYVPDKPRVTMVTVNGKPEPELDLVKIRYPDPANPQTAKEISVLQFSFSLALPPGADPVLRESISGRTGIPAAQIRLSALPIESSQATLYSPTTKEFVASVQGAGAAPLFATQKITIMMELTGPAASDFYDTLLNKASTGIPVAVSWTYTGLTEPAKIMVDVDYGLLYDHYSSDEGARAEASYYGLWGASAEYNATTIRNTLENKGALKIRVKAGSGLTLTDLDKHLQPILAMVNQEVLASLEPPKEVNPAVAPRAYKGGYFGSANWSKSVKMQSTRKSIKRTIDMEFQNAERRTTVASGFISLALPGVTDEIRARHVFTTELKARYDAFFPLPDVPAAEELGISQITYTINVEGTPVGVDEQKFVWKPTKGWRDVRNLGGPARESAFLPLSAAGVTKDNIGKVKYRLTTNVTVNNRAFSFVKSVDATAESVSVDPPSGDWFEPVMFHSDALEWRQPGAAAGLVAVDIEVMHASTPRSFKARLTPTSTAPGRILLPHRPDGSVGPVTAKVTFVYANGKVVAWEHNGKNLNDLTTGLTVYLVAPPGP